MNKEEVGIALVILCLMFVLMSCDSNSEPAVKPPVVKEQPKEIKPVPKKEIKPEPKKEIKPTPKEDFVPYKEKVCITVNGKEKCRTITKHQKHEGTKIKK